MICLVVSFVVVVVVVVVAVVAIMLFFETLIEFIFSESIELSRKHQINR